MGPFDKVAIVTGAGSGIGRQVALALLGEGYSVALAGRRAEPVGETVTQAGPAGSRMLAVATDVGDPASVAALFAKTKDRFGRLESQGGKGVALQVLAALLPLFDLTTDAVSCGGDKERHMISLRKHIVGDTESLRPPLTGQLPVRHRLTIGRMKKDQPIAVSFRR